MNGIASLCLSYKLFKQITLHHQQPSWKLNGESFVNEKIKQMSIEETLTTICITPDSEIAL